jgi:putative N6-adenine-specific DNA methylase
MDAVKRGHVFLYQQDGRYFAQIAGGLEELGAAELRELGATGVEPAHRGLYFKADPATLYRITYRTRLLSRILAPLVTFQCHTPEALYNKSQRVDWPSLLGVDQTFAVFANVSRSKITHSQYAALKLKDAVADQFRERCGRRPSVDPRDPDLWINLHIAGTRATVSLDVAGGSLHRRGYRRATVEAPLQECVAAAVLALSGWDGERPLYDPMCGSGTLISEAWLKYCRIPAGYLRGSFGFELLPDFDAQVWREVKAASDELIREPPGGHIRGSDIDARAVAATRTNNACLPHGDELRVRTLDFRAIAGLENRVIVCNPPYGRRIGPDGDIGAFYGELGDFLKQRCTGSEAYIYCGERELIKKIGLRAAWKKPLANGGLDGRLVKYELY